MSSFLLFKGSSPITGKTAGPDSSKSRSIFLGSPGAGSLPATVRFLGPRVSFRLRRAGQETSEFPLVLAIRVRAGEYLRLLPAAPEDGRERQLASPGRIYGVDKLPVVAAALLAILREAGVLLLEELLDGRNVAGEIGRDAEDPESLAAELPLKPRKLREFLAAGHAPGRPEIDERDVPALLRDPLL